MTGMMLYFDLDLFIVVLLQECVISQFTNLNDAKCTSTGFNVALNSNQHFT
jgi:hypothetical protein